MYSITSINPNRGKHNLRYKHMKAREKKERQPRDTFFQKGNRLGGNIDDGLTMTPQQRAVTAAEKRREDSLCGKKEVKNRMNCDNLIGRIEAIYAGKNKEPPFGLRAASLWALKKYLKKALKPTMDCKDIIIENENCYRKINIKCI